MSLLIIDRIRKTWQRSNAHDNTLEESAMRLRCHIEDNSSQQGDGCPRSSRKDEKNNGAQCRLNVDCQIQVFLLCPLGAFNLRW